MALAHTNLNCSRCYDTIGIEEYNDAYADGLQILRYNTTKAYVPHHDNFPNDPETKYNFDSAKKGGNRFATVLLYMSNLGERDGGETVFPHAFPIGQAEEDRVSLQVVCCRQSFFFRSLTCYLLLLLLASIRLLSSFVNRVIFNI
jgi:hypothetical protein